MLGTRKKEAPPAPTAREVDQGRRNPNPRVRRTRPVARVLPPCVRNGQGDCRPASTTPRPTIGQALRGKTVPAGGPLRPALATLELNSEPSAMPRRVRRSVIIPRAAYPASAPPRWGRVGRDATRHPHQRRSGDLHWGVRVLVSGPLVSGNANHSRA